MINYQSAEDAISLIKNNERVFVHGGAATPNLLIDTLALNTGNLSDIEFVQIIRIPDSGIRFIQTVFSLAQTYVPSSTVQMFSMFPFFSAKFRPCSVKV